MGYTFLRRVEKRLVKIEKCNARKKPKIAAEGVMMTIHVANLEKTVKVVAVGAAVPALQDIGHQTITAIAEIVAIKVIVIGENTNATETKIVG